VKANLDSMFSAKEIDSLIGVDKPEDMTPLTRIKYSVYNVLAAACSGSGKLISNVFMLQQERTIRAFILIDDIKLDSSAHTIVADAYIWPLTNETAKTHRRDIVDLARRAVSIECDAKVLVWWADFIQASIERSREWSHSERCYENELAHAHIEDRVMLSRCSCGTGKVSPEFRSRKDWAKFAPLIDRFALSPFFPVPYVNPTGAILSTLSHDFARRCWACYSATGTLKKCARCGVAKYCSRDCQTKDWARHKRECQS
jgi:hypothetical protein